jgi:hypothetical protein
LPCAVLLLVEQHVFYGLFYGFFWEWDQRRKAGDSDRLTKIYAETSDPDDFCISWSPIELIDFTLNCRSVRFNFDYTFTNSFLVTA